MEGISIENANLYYYEKKRSTENLHQGGLSCTSIVRNVKNNIR